MSIKGQKYDTDGYEGVKADKLIKACPKCSKCWEPDIMTSRNLKNNHRGSGKRIRTIYNYYYNFPKYGKTVEVCPKCI